MRFLRSLCFGLLVLTATAGYADDTLLCVQGKSFVPEHEFVQTRQLRFTADGPPLGDLLPLLAGRGVREKLWPELAADQVQVMPFDAALCGSEPTAELTLRYTADDLAVFERERNRGPSEQPRLRSAEAKPAAARTAPPGTPDNARRHDWVRLYFATSRRATGADSAAQAFGKERSDRVSLGAVEVSIPFDHRWARLESPSLLRLEWDANPQRHVVLAPALTRLEAKDWQAEIARRAGAFDKPGVLLFVHGYQNSFADAAKRAAQLAYDLAFTGPTVLFSWPSDGELLAYVRDEEDARNAWRQMADLLDQLSRLGPGVPVYVIAHSMGNRILTQGLAELLRRRPDAERAFRQVILASPDIGREEFRQRWVHDLATASVPRFTLYASDQDLPVALSAWLHGEPRLGAGGANIVVFNRLDSIDASAITREWFGLSHSYFGDNDSVLSDLFVLIHQGTEPDKRPRLRAVSGGKGKYWEFRR
ncbi:MAG: alpha/beta hydrolase [Candidatus Accumulibacter sp. UW26]|jgi:esterase/lipase superfamily enzyme|uniref:Alpha/beta hydrolase n=1 Tax=Candidatus Accumulibacter contiguus TaxID=2954381 RepID=A0ABX1TDB1_9PROT|nr:alpha/beta hydrolase [Candidatus Accumulibacter contiguus]NMQ07644.1 alpha/beta hydrolase [Candidatus Accumulibacter contiguus]